MNIVVFGAGAIGSLFGAMLSKNNNVLLIGRKNHIKAINKYGLKIKGKTNIKVKLNAKTSVNSLKYSPDLFILTVKSYDTEKAILNAKKIIGKKTVVLSLQNGLDNINKIEKIVDKKNIICGVTTCGAFFKKPGIIEHTGTGLTIIGELNSKNTERINNINNVFSKSGIKTNVSQDILKEIWTKAIINASINPLTAVFKCKNGHLLKNPILEKIVEKICIESTSIVNANNICISNKDIIRKTKDVIKKTSENLSSMYQSCMKGRKTEIDSINGKFVDLGIKLNEEREINEIIINSIKILC